MPVVICGWRSRIAVEFRALLPLTERAIRGTDADFPVGADRYLFTRGLLRPKRLEDQTAEERDESWEVNVASVIRLAEKVLAENDRARICVIGSESAIRGSFDQAYAAGKWKLHRWVETRRLSSPHQQLVAISPGIIADCAMTTRRKDVKALAERKADHPMGRFLQAWEVAEMAKTLLYDQPYVSGTVVRMHGGLV